VCEFSVSMGAKDAGGEWRDYAIIYRSESGFLDLPAAAEYAPVRIENIPTRPQARTLFRRHRDRLILNAARSVPRSSRRWIRDSNLFRDLFNSGGDHLIWRKTLPV